MGQADDQMPLPTFGNHMEITWPMKQSSFFTFFTIRAPDFCQVWHSVAFVWPVSFPFRCGVHQGPVRPCQAGMPDLGPGSVGVMQFL